jgi:hypothetical protein
LIFPFRRHRNPIWIKTSVKTAGVLEKCVFSTTFLTTTNRIETMLELCKQVLTKVSFDRFLFRKELQKAIRWLTGEDLEKLKQWCIDQYGNTYSDIIISSFRPVM